MELFGARILVTGGTGFLGKALISKLRTCPLDKLVIPSRYYGNFRPDTVEFVGPYDLTNKQDVRDMLRIHRPEIVIHLAAEVGGIGANQANPGRFFYSNMVMGLNLIEESRLANVEKFICLGTVCAYPCDTPVPFKEESLWDGYPEITNAPYGIAKKALLTMLQAYHEQYGFDSVFLLPVNMYGPFDNFDLKTSHVIPALIRKFYEAVRDKSEEVELWGTGEASREFLFVDDCADAIISAIGITENIGPFNVGTGKEIKIRDLAIMIGRYFDYNGKIVYDTSKPDGQPRRCLDITRFHEVTGWSPATSLEHGLLKTIDSYKLQLEEEYEGPL